MELSNEQVIELFQNISTTTETLKRIDATLDQIDTRLKEGEDKFRAINGRLSIVEAECIRRGYFCPTVGMDGKPASISLEQKSDMKHDPKMILIGLAALGLSIWGLVQIIAHLLGLALKMPGG
jgi:hypothetical protein